jgi:hypothetical protein
LAEKAKPVAQAETTRLYSSPAFIQAPRLFKFDDPEDCGLEHRAAIEVYLRHRADLRVVCNFPVPQFERL